LSVALALTIAWITIRTNAPFRRLFELTAIIPNILPTLLITISWVLLLNPSNGLINVALIRLLGLKKARSQFFRYLSPHHFPPDASGSDGRMDYSRYDFHPRVQHFNISL
jgi:ABC-type sugar transport system permease subunit